MGCKATSPDIPDIFLHILMEPLETILSVLRHRKQEQFHLCGPWSFQTHSYLWGLARNIHSHILRELWVLLPTEETCEGS